MISIILLGLGLLAVLGFYFWEYRVSQQLAKEWKIAREKPYYLYGSLFKPDIKVKAWSMFDDTVRLEVKEGDKLLRLEVYEDFSMRKTANIFKEYMDKQGLASMQEIGEND